MGQKIALPKLSRRTLEVVGQYNVRESHLDTLWSTFLRLDTNYNGVWTLHECYELIQEARTSMVGPFIDALFEMACKDNNGQMKFEDYLAFLSYCALSREEILQFMFLVIDKDRNSKIDKPELKEFFLKTAPVKGQTVFYFPANNAKCLDLFHNGKWDNLIFEELAQLVEDFPLVGFAVFHLQFLLRNALLGEGFWNKWDEDRLRAFYMEAESMSVKQTKVILGETITLSKPGRFTFKELMEYSRRKSYSHKGRKVARTEKLSVKGSITDERDEAISRTPLLNLIRNPTNNYHVPYVVPVYCEVDKVEEVLRRIDTPRDDDSSIASESD